MNATPRRHDPDRVARSCRCRWAACRRRPSRSSCAATSRSPRSCPRTTGRCGRGSTTAQRRRLPRPLAPRAPRTACRRAAEAEAHRRRRGRRRRRRRVGRSASRSSESAPMLYDLTALQRDANSRFGFTADPHAGRRPGLLRAAQGHHLPAHELALPVAATWCRRCARSRAHVGARRRRHYEAPAAYVAGLDVLPLGRVVNDAKVTDHHAIIPTDDAHTLSRAVERRAPHLRPGRAALPRRLPPRRPVRADDDRDRGRRRSGSARAARS